MSPSVATSAQSSSQAATDAQLQSIVQNLDKVNARLAEASPREILEWAIDNLPGLYQTTAFGLTGCVTLDLVSRISQERAAKEGKVSGAGNGARDEREDGDGPVVYEFHRGME